MITRIIGSGDAFGSGGRFNTCFYVEGSSTRFLIDCGASSLIALKHFNIDPNRIDYIFLSHLHGDHFGGIPFLERETQIESIRENPMVIVGPLHSQKTIDKALEVFFPGSTLMPSKIPLIIKEYEDEISLSFPQIKLTAFPMVHTKGTNPHALRIEFENKTIVYSGDTEWNENLVKAVDGADLFICETYKMDLKKNHMDYTTLLKNKERLNCDRIILTHMSAEVLDQIDNLIFECAFDGMVIDL